MKTSEIKLNEQLFTEYYLSCFPNVASYVKKTGGSLDDAKDIFQDAIIALYEKKQNGNPVDIILDENNYLTGIARKMWLKKISKENKLERRSLNTIYERPFTETESKVSEQLYQYIEQAGKKCLELLKGFYYDKLSMNEIAEKFQFSGERSATVQKHKCLKKIRNTIQAKFLKKEDFYE